MTVVVISIKKHMEERAEELAMAAVSSYQTVLTAIGKAATQAAPQPGADLTEKLIVLAELPEEIAAEDITTTQIGVEREIAQWGDAAAQYFRNKVREIRETMMAVTNTAATLGERDELYASRFSGLATKLDSIAEIEDLSRVRRSVLESANELKTTVVKMAEEGEKAIAQLRREVASYRSKLLESEKRECIDPLTGLVNRREIEAQIDERMTWRRTFCVAMIDLNGFKPINDVYGHVAGDDLLRQFSGELKAQFRATDVVGRWGGDEFVVVVDADFDGAKLSMDRTRRWAFGKYKIGDGRAGVTLKLGASIGLAAWDGHESIIELIARADELMYAEKKGSGLLRDGAA
jgi:diguanylate cyclase (GGDEF)-like protein